MSDLSDVAGGHVVVVLNWRGREDTLACVASLAAGSGEATVVVVDNGSADGTLEALALDWPAVKRLALERNYGFSGGMNRGIRYALDVLEAEVVTILNNDTVIAPGAMSALATIARSGDVAVSPVVNYQSDVDRMWFGGGSLDRTNGFPFHTPTAQLPECVDGVRRSTVLAGCCITARADVWGLVGLFDERFFLNFEDSEWSVRASQRNVRLLVACDVRILHAVSASFTGSASTLGSFYYLRNGLLFARLVGAGSVARLRFIRRFGLGGMRGQGLRMSVRRLVVLGWAVGASVVRHYGEAPRGLRRLAERWAQEKS